MVIADRISLDDFLALEETKPYREFIDGQILEKAMPGPDHSALVAALVATFWNYLRNRRVARVDTELRHANRTERRAYLPDVSVTLRSRFPNGQHRGVIEVTPDIAVEVLSPEDSPGRVMEKVQFYLRSGVPLTWVVDPEGEAVIVYRPGAEPTRLIAPGALDASPVLDGFSLPLADLFAVLHDED